MPQEYPKASDGPLLQESATDYIGPRIKELCEQQKVTKYRLSQLTGLTQTVLANIIRKKSIPTIQTLDKICMALHISLSQFFAQDEKMVLLSPEQRELIDIWNGLDAESRSQLMTIARTFQK